MSALPGIDQLKGEVPAGTPLEQLAAASELAGQLRARGDELLDEFVNEARSTGSSWTEIGSTLGTSKQAAHERFAALADPAAGAGAVRAHGHRGRGARHRGRAGARARSSLHPA